ENTMASTASTSVSGPSASVSRVPGPPPPTATAATARAPGRITVTPVAASASWADPTVRSPTSVMRLSGPRRAVMRAKPVPGPEMQGPCLTSLKRLCSCGRRRPVYERCLYDGPLRPAQDGALPMRLTTFAAVSAIALAATLSACTAALQNQSAPPVSLTTNPVTPPAQWRLEGRAMVSAADRRAVEAALEAMKRGGSAVDAAIAAHAVLGLVEPQSSGLGGGGYMVVYDRKSNTTTVFDGRESAPAAATASYF